MPSRDDAGPRDARPAGLALPAAPRAEKTLRRGEYAHLMQPNERLAVIDLGSNSFRLVVFMAGSGWWKRTDEIYEPVRIGEGLMASGRLGEEPMRRALATLDVFAHFCRASGTRRGDGRRGRDQRDPRRGERRGASSSGRAPAWDCRSGC